jgi:hypothetical protein
MVPATFFVRTSPIAAGWTVSVDSSRFSIGGPDECAANIRVSLRAPQNAPLGARESCDVSVYAKRQGARDSTLIGGVTIQSVVPGNCRVIGQVIGPEGRPRRGAKLLFQRELRPEDRRATWEEDRQATTDEDGVFDFVIPAGAHRKVRIDAGDLGVWTIPVHTECGVGTIRIQVTREGARIVR